MGATMNIGAFILLAYLLSIVGGFILLLVLPIWALLNYGVLDSIGVAYLCYPFLLTIWSK